MHKSISHFDMGKFIKIKAQLKILIERDIDKNFIY